MEEEAPEAGDALFGYTVRKLRERKGLSQAALADAMRGEGRPWYQSTVGRVETGRQPPQFADAVALAVIFGVPLERFTWKPAEANAADALYMAAERVRGCAEDVAHATGALLSARHLAGRALEDTAKYDSPRLRDAREILDGALEAYDLDAAVGEGMLQYRELTGSSDEEGDADDPDAQGEPRVDDQRRAE